MRAAFLLLLTFSLFLSCSNDPPALTETGTTDYLPSGADTVFQIPSYRKAVVEGFSIATHLFGKESSTELQDKIFRILSGQWRIPLLNPSKLRAQGADPDRPVLIAGFGGGAFYASIPISSAQPGEKTIRRLFPELIKASGSKGSARFQTPDGKTRFIITVNRLYILYRIKKRAKKKGAYPALLFRGKKNSFRAWLSARSVVQSGLPLISSVRAPLFLEYSRRDRRLLIRALIFRKNTPPVFSGLLPKSARLPERVFTWQRYGAFPGNTVSARDLFFLSFSVSTEKIWNSFVYPAIRREVMKRFGGLGFLASRLFSPGKSPVDKAIARYGIKEDIFNRLTGKIAIRLRGITGIPGTGSGMLDSGQISLLLEATTAADAKKIIGKLGGLLKMFKIRMQEWGEDGFTFYEIPLLRLRMMRYLYISRMGKVLTLSFRKQEVLGKSNTALKNRGGKWAAAGSLSPIVNRGRLRCWLTLSVTKTLILISKFVDWKTRANLGPLTGQLAKLSRLNLTMSKNGAFPLLSTEFILRGRPETRDPFTDKTDETDILLYALGIFFLSLIAIVFIRYFYKKIRYRN